ncbi:MAG: hypothetical protein UV36_C0003G0008 [Parcubacteria group bacterium GW2011_GWC2_42_6]|nr:MAG: hypothetical protein UU87_C0003G0060 [Parcubacteria group bacterium GW2011_GWA2_42_11]KKS68037.1 MAG: hypothetical protein UV36_C0003G0008 [Parcubacteria group bacterium GW2011_GWC2_42_6]
MIDYTKFINLIDGDEEETPEEETPKEEVAEDADGDDGISPEDEVATL